MNAGYNIRARLELDNSDFKRQMTASLMDINSLKASADAFSNSSLKLTHNLKDVSRVVSGIVIAQTFYTAARAVSGAAKEVVKFSADMEQASVSLRYFADSSVEVIAYLRDLSEFAAKTPFSVQSVVGMAKYIQAMGVAQKNTKSFLGVITDTASATGATEKNLTSITEALGKMLAKGRLTAMEVRQLASAGTPIYNIIQEELGITKKQLESIGTLWYPAEKAIVGILSGLEKRYKGASAEIEATLLGMFATIKDNALLISQSLLAPIYDGFKGEIAKVRTYLDEVRESISTIGLGGTFEALIPPDARTRILSFITVVKTLGLSLRSLWEASKPIAAAIGDIIYLVANFGISAISLFARGASNLLQVLQSLGPVTRIFSAGLSSLLIMATVVKITSLFGGALATLMVRSYGAAQSLITLGGAVQYSKSAIGNTISTVLALASAITMLITTFKGLKNMSTDTSRAMSGFDKNGFSAALEKYNKEMAEYNKKVDSVKAGFNENYKGIASSYIDDFGVMSDEGQAILDAQAKANDKVNKKSASDAKKAAKALAKELEPFEAAFDELYLIPDKDSNDPTGVADTLEDLGLGDLEGMGADIGSGFNTEVIDKLGGLIPPTLEYTFDDSFGDLFGDGEGWLSKMLGAILSIGSVATALAISAKTRKSTLDSIDKNASKMAKGVGSLDENINDIKRATERYNSTGLSDDLADSWRDALIKSVADIADTSRYVTHRLDEVRLRIAEIDDTLGNKFIQIYDSTQRDLAKERKALVFEEKQLVEASEKIASNIKDINAGRATAIENSVAPIQKRLAELLQEIKKGNTSRTALNEYKKLYDKLNEYNKELLSFMTPDVAGDITGLKTFIAPDSLMPVSRQLGSVEKAIEKANASILNVKNAIDNNLSVEEIDTRMSAALSDVESAIKQQRLHGFEQGVSLPDALLKSQEDFSKHLGKAIDTSTDVLSAAYSKATQGVENALLMISNEQADAQDKLAKIRLAMSDIKKYITEYQKTGVGSGELFKTERALLTAYDNLFSGQLKESELMSTFEAVSDLVTEMQLKINNKTGRYTPEYVETLTSIQEQLQKVSYQVTKDGVMLSALTGRTDRAENLKTLQALKDARDDISRFIKDNREIFQSMQEALSLIEQNIGGSSGAANAALRTILKNIDNSFKFYRGESDFFKKIITDLVGEVKTVSDVYLTMGKANKDTIDTLLTRVIEAYSNQGAAIIRTLGEGVLSTDEISSRIDFFKNTIRDAVLKSTRAVPYTVVETSTKRSPSKIAEEELNALLEYMKSETYTKIATRIEDLISSGDIVGARKELSNIISDIKILQSNTHSTGRRFDGIFNELQKTIHSLSSTIRRASTDFDKIINTDFYNNWKNLIANFVPEGTIAASINKEILSYTKYDASAAALMSQFKTQLQLITEKSFGVVDAVKTFEQTLNGIIKNLVIDALNADEATRTVFGLAGPGQSYISDKIGEQYVSHVDAIFMKDPDRVDMRNVSMIEISASRASLVNKEHSKFVAGASLETVLPEQYARMLFNSIVTGIEGGKSVRVGIADDVYAALREAYKTGPKALTAAIERAFASGEISIADFDIQSFIPNEKLASKMMGGFDAVDKALKSGSSTVANAITEEGKYITGWVYNASKRGILLSGNMHDILLSFSDSLEKLPPGIPRGTSSNVLITRFEEMLKEYKNAFSFVREGTPSLTLSMEELAKEAGTLRTSILGKMEEHLRVTKMVKEHLLDGTRLILPEGYEALDTKVLDSLKNYVDAADYKTVIEYYVGRMESIIEHLDPERYIGSTIQTYVTEFNKLKAFQNIKWTDTSLDLRELKSQLIAQTHKVVEVEREMVNAINTLPDIFITKLSNADIITKMLLSGRQVEYTPVITLPGIIGSDVRVTSEVAYIEPTVTETPVVTVNADKTVVVADTVVIEGDPLDELIDFIKVNNIPSNINAPTVTEVNNTIEKATEALQKLNINIEKLSRVEYTNALLGTGYTPKYDDIIRAPYLRSPLRTLIVDVSDMFYEQFMDFTEMLTTRGGFKNEGYWMRSYYGGDTRENGITDKLYVTIENVEELLPDAIGKVLVDIHNILVSNGFTGQMKFPSALPSLLNRIDHVVIHGLGSQLEVLEKILDKGIHLRVEKGFDIPSMSFSQILDDLIKQGVSEITEGLLNNIRISNTLMPKTVDVPLIDMAITTAQETAQDISEGLRKIRLVSSPYKKLGFTASKMSQDIDTAVDNVSKLTFSLPSLNVYKPYTEAGTGAGAGAGFGDEGLDLYETLSTILEQRVWGAAKANESLSKLYKALNRTTKGRALSADAFIDLISTDFKHLQMLPEEIAQSIIDSAGDINTQRQVIKEAIDVLENISTPLKHEISRLHSLKTGIDYAVDTPDWKKAIDNVVYTKGFQTAAKIGQALFSEYNAYALISSWNTAGLAQGEQAQSLLDVYGNTPEDAKRVSELYKEVQNNRTWFDKNVMGLIKTGFTDGSGRPISEIDVAKNWGNFDDTAKQVLGAQSFTEIPVEGLVGNIIDFFGKTVNAATLGIFDVSANKDMRKRLQADIGAFRGTGSMYSYDDIPWYDVYNRFLRAGENLTSMWTSLDITNKDIVATATDYYKTNYQYLDQDTKQMYQDYMDAKFGRVTSTYDETSGVYSSPLELVRILTELGMDTRPVLDAMTSDGSMGRADYEFMSATLTEALRATFDEIRNAPSRVDEDFYQQLDVKGLLTEMQNSLSVDELVQAIDDLGRIGIRISDDGITMGQITQDMVTAFKVNMPDGFSVEELGITAQDAQILSQAGITINSDGTVTFSNPIDASKTGLERTSYMYNEDSINQGMKEASARAGIVHEGNKINLDYEKLMAGATSKIYSIGKTNSWLADLERATIVDPSTNKPVNATKAQIADPNLNIEKKAFEMFGDLGINIGDNYIEITKVAEELAKDGIIKAKELWDQLPQSAKDGLAEYGIVFEEGNMNINAALERNAEYVRTILDIPIHEYTPSLIAWYESMGITITEEGGKTVATIRRLAPEFADASTYVGQKAIDSLSDSSKKLLKDMGVTFENGVIDATEAMASAAKDGVPLVVTEFSTPLEKLDPLLQQLLITMGGSIENGKMFLPTKASDLAALIASDYYINLNALDDNTKEVLKAAGVSMDTGFGKVIKIAEDNTEKITGAHWVKISELSPQTIKALGITAEEAAKGWVAITNEYNVGAGNTVDEMNPILEALKLIIMKLNDEDITQTEFYKSLFKTEESVTPAVGYLEGLRLKVLEVLGITEKPIEIKVKKPTAQDYSDIGLPIVSTPGGLKPLGAYEKSRLAGERKNSAQYKAIKEELRKAGYDVSGYQTGGIISEDGLYRAGEFGAKEAIIPLERQDALKLVGKAIAPFVAPATAAIPSFSMSFIEGISTALSSVMYSTNSMSETTDSVVEAVEETSSEQLLATTEVSQYLQRVHETITLINSTSTNLLSQVTKSAESLSKMSDTLVDGFSNIMTWLGSGIKYTVDVSSDDKGRTVGTMETFSFSEWRDYADRILNKYTSDIDKSLYNAQRNAKIDALGLDNIKYKTWQDLVASDEFKGMAGQANGGIVTRDSLYRLGERNKREAVIPLSDPSALSSIGQAIAANMTIEIPGGHQSGGDERPILYVGTLVADDRGIRELERRMKVIRMEETNRTGVR